MAMNETRHGILVGVTAPGENTSALRWAAEEGAATHEGVTLVHTVDPIVIPPPPSVVVASEPVLAFAREALHDVVEEYTALTDGAPPRSALHTGHPAMVLTDLSENADLVVLAHRSLNAFRRIITWSTTMAVAAHAQCPVVAVPTDWPREGVSQDDPGWVTVGIHERGAPEPVLRAGFEAAASHGRRLRLVHAWRSDPQYDEIILRRIGTDWRQRTEEELLSAAETLTAKYPDVEVEATAVHQLPADALARLASTSALLVVGRHGQHASLPTRIGSVARTALHTGRCPVMVVPV